MRKNTFKYLTLSGYGITRIIKINNTKFNLSSTISDDKIKQLISGETPATRDELRWLISNDYPFDNVDVSQIEDMSYMFHGFDNVLIDITNWKTDSMVNAEFMFFECVLFNQEIGKWNTAKLKYSSSMFEDCVHFNANLNNWDVRKLIKATSMFSKCIVFDNPLNNWKTDSLESADYMFYRCEYFNQNLNQWNVGNVRNFERMFLFCYKYNQPMNDWDVSNGDNFTAMFNNCWDLNQPFDKWRIRKDALIKAMFVRCESLNQNFEKWYLQDNENYYENIFAFCPSMNQNFSTWIFNKNDDVTNAFNDSSKIHSMTFFSIFQAVTSRASMCFVTAISSQRLNFEEDVIYKGSKICCEYRQIGKIDTDMLKCNFKDRKGISSLVYKSKKLFLYESNFVLNHETNWMKDFLIDYYFLVNEDNQVFNIAYELNEELKELVEI